MRHRSSTPPRVSARLPLCAALIAALLAAAPAVADTGHAEKAVNATATRTAPVAAGGAQERGMTAGEHADMQPAAKDNGAAAAHGGRDAAGTADDEAARGASGGDHGGAAVEHSGGRGEPAAADRPVAAVLGGFGAVNGIVLIAAVVLRRRPAAVKRRATLARVRSAAGTGTAPPTPTVKSRS